MEAILLMGLQGAGKSSFYKAHYFRSHVRISLDLLGTRHREMQFLELCLETGQRLVIDNTNPARSDRRRYIEPAKAAKFQVFGIYFQSIVKDCLRRNANRSNGEWVPPVAICATSQKIELPTFMEGFDRLSYVRLEEGTFMIEDWYDEF